LIDGLEIAKIIEHNLSHVTLSGAFSATEGSHSSY